MFLFDDIALIKLPKPIQLSENVQPIAMPQRCVDTDVAGLRVYAAGVGRTFYGQRLEDSDGLLRHAIFTTYGRSVYNDLVPGYDGAWASTILASSRNGSGIAAGDSG